MKFETRRINIKKSLSKIIIFAIYKHELYFTLIYYNLRIFKAL